MEVRKNSFIIQNNNSLKCKVLNKYDVTKKLETFRNEQEKNISFLFKTQRKSIVRVSLVIDGYVNFMFIYYVFLNTEFKCQYDEEKSANMRVVLNQKIVCNNRSLI